ncbi:hypothetical protein HPB52_019475 [Rhipicephalus sanguineus]|uniref:Uncharacterized protein n=1 Tax=Rhipicephalus sanguineus TaxID=34632 RepID=A0A9D4Q2A4_RHISA|nr:hypothetical protein HPB52_019475 [Rhipicephalus sanguineus]
MTDSVLTKIMAKKTINDSLTDKGRPNEANDAGDEVGDAQAKRQRLLVEQLGYHDGAGEYSTSPCEPREEGAHQENPIFLDKHRDYQRGCLDGEAPESTVMSEAGNGAAYLRVEDEADSDFGHQVADGTGGDQGNRFEADQSIVRAEVDGGEQERGDHQERDST